MNLESTKKATEGMQNTFTEQLLNHQEELLFQSDLKAENILLSKKVQKISSETKNLMYYKNNCQLLQNLVRELIEVNELQKCTIMETTEQLELMRSENFYLKNSVYENITDMNEDNDEISIKKTMFGELEDYLVKEGYGSYENVKSEKLNYSVLSKIMTIFKTRVVESDMIKLNKNLIKKPFDIEKLTSISNDILTEIDLELTEMKNQLHLNEEKEISFFNFVFELLNDIIKLRLTLNNYALSYCEKLV
ncbi:hypothetical protein HK099_001697 [Clydaea vesicula]|uniref:Uncharacterized protein n=1 Tax=Clydaea vesicula TaxID=447962 RepID=A0AAD5TW50_9FUNG|nr:hypothetical protein HK099_001697 [Clydaea vesicula]